MLQFFSTLKSTQIVLLILLSFSALDVFAALRTASQSGLWSASATWGGAAAPTAADDVTIGAFTVTVAANSFCNSLLLNNTSSILVINSGITLEVDGSSTNSSNNAVNITNTNARIRINGGTLYNSGSAPITGSGFINTTSGGFNIISGGNITSLKIDDRISLIPTASTIQLIGGRDFSLNSTLSNNSLSNTTITVGNGTYAYHEMIFKGPTNLPIRKIVFNNLSTGGLEVNSHDLVIYDLDGGSSLGKVDFGSTFRILRINGTVSNYSGQSGSFFSTTAGTVYFCSGLDQPANANWTAISQIIPSGSPGAYNIDYFNLKIRVPSGQTATIGSGSGNITTNAFLTVNGLLELGVANSASGTITTDLYNSSYYILTKGTLYIGTSTNNGNLTLNLNHRIQHNTSGSISANNNANNIINVRCVDAVNPAIKNYSVTSQLYGTVNYQDNPASSTDQVAIPAKYVNMTVNRSNSAYKVVLNNDISVGISGTAGTLLMTQGTLDVAGNDIVMTANTSNVVSGESNTNRIMCTGCAAGTTDGKITYSRSLSASTAYTSAQLGGLGALITTGTTAPGTTTIARGFYSRSGNALQSSILRYFDITPATNSGLNAMLQINYWTAELNSLTEANLFMFRDAGTDQWGKQEPFTLNTTSHFISKSNISAFSSWTAGSEACGTPLNGTYSIGGTTPDYATFAAAVNALIQCGISGPVVFDVRTATYTEQISIPEISGASATNTITFRAESGNRADVTLTAASSASISTNYTLQLDGADYFRFNDMTIQRSGTNTYANVVNLAGDVFDNRFDNVVFSGRTGSASASAALVLSDDNNSGNSTNTFEDCHFLNGSAGIWYEGASGSLKPGLSVQNSDFENYRYGLYLEYLETVTVSGNTFTNGASYNSASSQGIYAFHVDNAFTISKNTFTYTASTSNTGIELQACQGTSGTVGVVSNNMIVVAGSGTVYGINSGSTTYYKNYYYNSVYNTGSNATSSSAYYQNGSDNINLKNNSFYATIGNAIEILAPTAGLVTSDYNNLYSTGTYVGNWGGANQTDLSAWKTASSKDANSISADPQYLSATDLHAASGSSMANAGNPITGITTDIDNENRDASTPDIGADEFSTSACTPGTWTAGAVSIADKTDWFNTANWTCSTVPTASIDVTIPASPSGGNYFPVLTGAVNGFTKDLTVEPNASVTISNTAELEVNGAFDYSGTAVIGNGFLTLKGSTASGTFTIGTLTIDRSAGVSLAASSAVSISKQLVLQTGTCTVPVNASLTLLSSSSETAFVNDFGANTGAYSGNITIQRYIPAGVVNSFHYIGSASGATASTWSDDFGNSANASDGTKVTPKPDCDPLALEQGSAYGSLFSYDESLVTGCYLDGWRVRTTGASAARGNGFAATISAGVVLDETGAYSKSNVTLSALSISSSNNVAYSKGYHLVANPFFAPVDWNAMAALGANSNVDGTAYIYNPNSGTYGTYNQITSGEIPTNMAFFVRGLSGSSFNVTFDAATRTTTGNEDFLKQGQPYLYGLKIKAGNGSFSDETLIAFDAGFSDGYDNGFDAAKLLSSYGIPSLYTRDALQERRAIEALGINTEAKSVPLGLLVPGAGGNYTFTFEGMEDFPQTTIVWLEDVQTGTIQYLRQNNTYSFIANEQDNPDRFIIHFAPELFITVTGADCSGSNAAITLEQRGGIEWSFRLKDENSAVLASDVFSATEVINQLTPGTYTLNLTHPASGYATTTTISVTGLQPVSAAISASSTQALENENISFDAQTTGATTNTWQMGDGTIFTDVTSVNYTYPSAGVYEIIFTASNDGCSAVSTIKVSVSKQDTGSTGIGTTERGDIRIFGNGDVLFISQTVTKNDADARVTVYNALGQIIAQADVKQLAYKAVYQMPVNAAAGIYYVHVELAEGKDALRKVVLGEEK